MERRKEKCACIKREYFIFDPCLKSTKQVNSQKPRVEKKLQQQQIEQFKTT